MTIDKNHPHTERIGNLPWELVFWKDGCAADRTDASSCCVRTWWPGSGWVEYRRYQWPKEQYKVEELLRIFNRIFIAGQRERSREFEALIKDQ